MIDTMTPPSADQAMPPRAAGSQTPTVLGVIGIIWAAISLLCTLSIFGDAQIQAKVYTTVSAVLGLLLGLWLLLGSINLLRRKRSARSMLVSWSIIKIVVTIALLVWGLAYTDQMTDMVVQQAQAELKADPAMQDGMAEQQDPSAAVSDQGEDVEPRLDGDAGEEDIQPELSDEQIESVIQIVVYGFMGCGAMLTLLWPVILLISLNSIGFKREFETWDSGMFEGHDHV
ncbi:MAG: hypothetical protein CMJ24_02990 [Phycisphaerae bacterium]|nr:hypothetical protein [Phycisphaerae bacterium]|tara:strand:+ start:478 stop:1164 length:687 start_codon:yes stop_codon:yes gene_type:complete